jgi:nitroreductase
MKNVTQEKSESLAFEIKERRSQTNWTNQAISTHVWDLLIEAARCAPSSWNHQPSRYILLKEIDLIKKVVSAFHRTNSWASKAAGLIVQIGNPLDDDRVDGKDYYLYDCGLAMMSLIYQGQVMGLTSRQMIGWDEKEVKQLLQIPDPYRVVVITALGYPSSSSLSQGIAEAKRVFTQQNKRYQVDHIAYWNTWKGGVFNEES